MKFRSIAVAMLPAALANCHAAQPPAQQSASNGQTAAQLAQKIAALPAPSRNGVFMRAITDAGYDCQQINLAQPHAPVQGRPAWTVLCQQNTPYVAVIDPQHYLQIVPGKIDPTPATS